MAHPKHRTSSTRRNKRRSHHRAEVPTLTSCSNCGATTKYHHICPECGYYRGKQVIEKDIAV